MRVGILHAMETEPDQFSSFFKAANAPFETQVFEITRGDYPDSSVAFDAFLISGSKIGVYDPDPWIADLSEFVRSCNLEQRKLIGICFGHQLIAHALGGYASKSEKGWGLGLHEFEITTQKPWMIPALDRCALYFSHQDQVTALPVGAELLGGSDFCPNAMYCIGDHMLGIQGHPEISQSLMAQVIERLKEQVGSKVYSDALNALSNGTPDARMVARWIINFINL
ncbi:MAG: GMP synthase [Chloroflexota bacterium]|nr:GMP synthase [Chloroflexota bacterium]